MGVANLDAESDMQKSSFCVLIICFHRRRVVQIFARGARILDGSYMTQELSFVVQNSDSTSNSESSTVSSVSIADPYILLKMTDGTIQLLVGGTASLSFFTLIYYFLNICLQIVFPIYKPDSIDGCYVFLVFLWS